MSLSINDLPISRRTLLAIGGGCAVAIAGASVWLLDTPGQSASLIGGRFDLTSGDGVPVTDRSFPGRYLLVYFGYTTCPDVCPTTLSDVADALQRLGAAADRVQPLFITIDPRRDTPAVVKQYAASFTPGLIGLTGTPGQIAAVARAYRVYYAPHVTGPGPDDYTMDHTSILYLMAPDGSFVAPIRADQDGPAMAADLQRHLT